MPGGISYAEFLLPGIFAQTVIFGSTITGASLAEDLQKGLIDRFRSLPMARSAVLVGRTVADLALNVLSIAVMAMTGLVVGWRINTSFGEAVAGFLLLLGFAYAISWLMAMVGLLVRTPEVVQQRQLHRDLPDHVRGQHVRPAGDLPAGAADLRGVEPGLLGRAGRARAVRQHLPLGPAPDAWSLQNPVLYTLIWGVAILVVFVPLSVRTYRAREPADAAERCASPESAGLASRTAPWRRMGGDERRRAPPARVP